MKVIKLITISISLLALSACDTTKIKAHIANYCECLKNNNNVEDKCIDIKDQILQDHPESTKEFSVIIENAKKCSNED